MALMLFDTFACALWVIAIAVMTPIVVVLCACVVHDFIPGNSERSSLQLRYPTEEHAQTVCNGKLIMSTIHSATLHPAVSHSFLHAHTIRPARQACSNVTFSKARAALAGAIVLVKFWRGDFNFVHQ